MNLQLVVSTQFKNMCQIRNLPQVSGWTWNHHPVLTTTLAPSCHPGCLQHRHLQILIHGQTRHLKSLKTKTPDGWRFAGKDLVLKTFLNFSFLMHTLYFWILTVCYYFFGFWFSWFSLFQCNYFFWSNVLVLLWNQDATGYHKET